MREILRAGVLLVLIHCWPAPAAGDVYRTYFPNGLEVTLVPDETRPMVGAMALVGAGLRTETFDTNGASHFLEHLLFNGTECLSQEKLYEQIDLLGGYCNAATREECTIYFILVPPEHVARAIGLLNRMLYHSTLPPAKAEKERGIILSELRQDRSMESLRADEALRSVLYRGTPYARPILGTETAVASISRDALLAYYRAFYVPNNTELVLIGDMDVSEAVQAVDSTFGQEPAREVPVARPAVPPRLPFRTMVAAPVDRPHGYSAIETPGPGDSLFPVLEVLAEVLRLRCAGMEPGFLEVEQHTYGQFSRLIVGARGELGSDPDLVLREVTEFTRQMAETPPSREEVHNAKARLQAGELFLREKLHFFLIARPNQLWAGGIDYALNRIRRLQAVGTEDVQALALALGDTSTLSTVVLVPPSAGATVGPEAAADTSLPGMSVRIRHEPGAPLFGLHIFFRDRNLQEPDGKAGLAEVLHRVVAAGPEAVALESRWASLGARVTFFDNPYFSHDDLYLSPRHSYLRLELPSDNWREGVSLLRQCLRSPCLADTCIEKAKANVLGALGYQARDARYLARTLFLRNLLGEHPAAAPALGAADEVGSMTASDVIRFHKVYMSRSNAVITAVGPGAPSVVATELASLLPEGPTASGVWPSLPATDADSTYLATLGTGRAHVVWGYVIGSVPSVSRPALRLAVSALSTAMAQHVREELGLAYGIGCGLHWVGDEAWIQVEAGTRPEVVDDVVRAIRSTIEEQRTRCFRDLDVRREAERRRGRSLLRSLTRVGAAYYMGLELLDGAHPLAGEDEVTAEDVTVATQRYVRTSPALTVVVQ